MRKIIYKLFFVAGFCASALGVNNSANATVSCASTNTMPILKVTDGSEKLYFTDAIKGSGHSQLYAQHYSHSSHSSHSSHQSHYSHVSSRPSPRPDLGY